MICFCERTVVRHHDLVNLSTICTSLKAVDPELSFCR